MSEARDIALTALDAFRDELAGRFIGLCHGNDGNRLTLEKIYDTIDEIYDKHVEKWSDVGTVDSVPTPKWISVKERLPEKLTEVVAYDSTHKIVHAMVYDGEGFRVHRCVRDEWIYDACITHWMPLPQPPKEEGE